jgi:1-acyl-sn-glycerol-3-phosphate acyltransferase
MPRRRSLDQDVTQLPLATRSDRDRFAYRAVMALVTPVIRWWGRLEVEGAELLPDAGSTLLLANHDSAWDPLVIGLAASPRRQVRALAKSSLWRIPILGSVLDGMGQIPIKRGHHDTTAMGSAVDQLRAGACIGVFPEGTRSRGRELRARSGAGRLALAVPDAVVLGVAVSGVVDIVKFPMRPAIRVRFFAPIACGHLTAESAAEVAAATLAEIREVAPIATAGRR